MFVRRSLSVAALAALAPAVHATDFSSTVFFGDSLTDSGYYKPLLGPSGAVVGKFTTNPGPIWAELLAADLGLSAAPANTAGGTDYAQGGARISQGPAMGVPTAFNTQTTVDQVNAYLASRGGRADGNALYTVWSGANDLFYALQTYGSNATLISNYVVQTSAEHAALIEQLAHAGARYILVPNLPDIGTSPFGLSQGAAASASITALTANYNNLLYGQLAANGVSVIPLDTFSLLHEIQANPARYGFTNVTLPACTTASSLTCTSATLLEANADQTYVFADGVHPTTATHAMVAEYALSVLQAGSQLALLADAPVRTRAGLIDTLLAQASAASSGKGGTHVWAAGGLGAQDYDASSRMPSAEGAPYGASVGVDMPAGFGAVGLALSLGNYSPDFGNGGGFEQRELAFSTYLAARHGAFTANLVGTLGYIDYDTSRSVTIGAAHRNVDGSTHGSNASLAAEVGYGMQSGELQHGPFVGVNLQRVEVKGFKETDTAGHSTELAVGPQERLSAVARLGYQLAWSAGRFTPYGRIAYEHEFGDTEQEIELSMPSVSAASFKLPNVTDVGADALRAVAGSGFTVTPGTDLWVEASGYFGRDELKQYGVSAGVRYAF